MWEANACYLCKFCPLKWSIQQLESDSEFLSLTISFVDFNAYGFESSLSNSDSLSETFSENSKKHYPY